MSSQNRALAGSVWSRPGHPGGQSAFRPRSVALITERKQFSLRDL